MSAPDVAVVGGGVIGLAVAWRAAGRGMSVEVFEPHPRSGASWAAAGMLAPVTEAHFGEERLLELNLESNARWPDFAAQLAEASGRDPGYVRCGTLVVARDADDAAVLADLLDFQRSLGLEVDSLPGRRARELEPALAPSVRRALHVPGDHQVDNRALVDALWAACGRAGVVHHPVAVTALETSGGRATGVRDDRGVSHPAGAVVIAAGCRSGSIEGLPGEARLPVRPVKGQLLHLRGPERLFERNLRGLEVYLVARPDGRVVVGATVEERGFDPRPTAGAVLDLLRAAFELVPGITELELVEVAVGWRPGSPDNAPLIGPWALDGLVVATGHYRNGILLTPVTADGVAELLHTGKVPAELEPFSPGRFGEARP